VAILIRSRRNPDIETERGRSIPVFCVRDWEGPLMTKKPTNDPKHWRDRAAAMRALADTVKDPETKSIMYRLADDYERLADRAARRQATADQ
jgi:hypothetical protein